MNPELYSRIIEVEVEAAKACLADEDITMEVSAKAAVLPHDLTEDELTICKHMLKHGIDLPSDTQLIRQIIWENGKFHAMQVFKDMLAHAMGMQIPDGDEPEPAGTRGLKPLDPHMQKIVRQAHNN